MKLLEARYREALTRFGNFGKSFKQVREGG